MVEITGGSVAVEQQIQALRAEIAALFRDVPAADRAGFARTVSTLKARIERHGAR